MTKSVKLFYCLVLISGSLPNCKGIFVAELYFFFNRHKIAINVLLLGIVGESKHECPVLYKSSIEELPLIQQVTRHLAKLLIV